MLSFLMIVCIYGKWANLENGRKTAVKFDIFSFQNKCNPTSVPRAYGHTVWYLNILIVRSLPTSPENKQNCFIIQKLNKSAGLRM